MDRTYLLDTGFLIALADARDPDHEDCRRVWGAIRGRFITVEGVLVEAAYLVRKNPGGFQAVLGLVTSVGTQIVPPSPERYLRARDLMETYQEVPMDLVDALLVAVAEERGLELVLSLDRRGFHTYRIRGRRRFKVIPADWDTGYRK